MAGRNKSPSSTRSKSAAADSNAGGGSRKAGERPAKRGRPRVKRAGGRGAAKKERSPNAATARVSKDSESIAEAPAEIQKTPDLGKLRAFQKAQRQSKAQAEKSKQNSARGRRFLAKGPKKGKTYTIDLRVHTPATVGYFSTGGIDAGEALVRLATVKKLDLIAITDYYNSSYIDVVAKHAEKAKLAVVPGLDLCCRIGSCSEVFVTALFPEEYDSARLERVLLELRVPREARGRQDYTLANDFAEVVAVVEANDGVLIPSGMDKTPYRQEVLPELVERFGFRAFDVVHPDDLSVFRNRWPDGEFTFFTFSNANALAQIGGRVTKIKLSEPGFSGLREVVSRRGDASVVAD